MRKRIITICGQPGSGKSTAARAVASYLGYEHFSSGDQLRAIGRERGIDIYQTNLAAEQEEELDHVVDQRLREIGVTEDEVVIDARLAWHWIPDSFKVYLNLDLEVAATRIISSWDPERLKHEHVPTDPKKYAAILQKRLTSEAGRYKKLYNADPYNKANYDLVVDTKNNTADQTVKQIVDAYQMWLASKG